MSLTRWHLIVMCMYYSCRLQQQFAAAAVVQQQWWLPTAAITSSGAAVKWVITICIFLVICLYLLWGAIISSV
jgi:hypothetical protein